MDVRVLEVDHFHFHIAPYFRLTAESVRIINDAHVLFAVVARTQVLHTRFHFAHAGCTETIAAACMFHGNAVIEGDL